MNNLAILGASGHGKVLAEIAEKIGWKNIFFFDDLFPKKKYLEHWKIIGTTDDLISQLNFFDGYIVGIGDNNVRLEKTRLLQSHSAKLISLKHPSSIVSNYSIIKEGSVIMAGVTINPFCKIGLSSIVNTMSSIDHDCILGEGVHIAPGVKMAGNINIGNKSFIGIGVTIKQGIQIGNNVIIGAGSLVLNDLKSNLVAFGVPAKVSNLQ
jgi:sugar O-acyltransferase (sialic acid O-acetyltransferase NeuD family)